MTETILHLVEVSSLLPDLSWSLSPDGKPQCTRNQVGECRHASLISLGDPQLNCYGLLEQRVKAATGGEITCSNC